MEEKGKGLGLILNESKTKLMKFSTSKERRSIEELPNKIDDKKFEGVSQFKYLGEVLTNTGKTSDAIRERIQIGNKAYFANQTLLKSKLITRKQR